MKASKIEINNVHNRFLPISESVLKGLEPEPKITDFKIVKELGAGSFGHVYLVKHKTTNAEYAIKAIDKRDKTNQEEKPYFRREIEVMYKLHHPNVVKLYGHFEDNNYCYFIMEYISKGNVYSLIPTDKKKRITSQVVASLMKDVISAVYYLHNMNPIIIHRDIKPENVLLAENLVAKLTDFGWSNYMREDEKRTTVCGTPIYLAPEIIKEEGHDEKVDIWCIGVLLFELITGSVPFPGNDIDTLKDNILHLKIAWPKDINIDAKNLIKRILKSDPAQRISLEEMLQHPFFTKHFPNAVKSLIKPEDTSKYQPFVVSKDNPKTWEPVISKSLNPPTKEKSPRKVSKSPERARSPKKEEEISQEKYDELKVKFANLRIEYENMKASNSTSNEIEDIKCQIKEKEERISQLTKMVKESGEDVEEKNLQERYMELENDNYGLKQKVLHYEEIIKERQEAAVENKLNEFRNSISGKDKESFSGAIDNLKKNLEKETRQKLKEVIKEKEKEIQKYKEDEKFRRDKEKKKFIALINKYDKTLSCIERENRELKDKLKKLEAEYKK